MKKNFYILLITAVSFTACSDTLCIGDDCGDGYEIDYSGNVGGYGGDVFDYNPYVILSNVCDLNSPDHIDTKFELSCEESIKLDYGNNQPNTCEEITLTDIDGNTVTGLYRAHVNNSIKCD